MSERVEISVLLPMYNEARRIEHCVDEVEKKVKSFSRSYEIIIAEDGSTDDTDIIGARLAEMNPRVKFLHSPVRLGKGKAIKKAMCVARGDVIVFLDADLATSLEHLLRIAEDVRRHRGMAIGSRYVVGSSVRRPFYRTFFSVAYNLLVRMFFGDGVRDHQCGFKAFSHELAEVLCGKVESNEWFVDTEMIVQAKRLGYAVTEVGVDWKELRSNGESKFKLFRDALRTGTELLKFRLRLYRDVAKTAQKGMGSTG
ncbi:MAG: glycosyltransferase [Candidatus Freyarchaeota archaeon]|nr:glycosyltransferase [Candidatus Jordarchaeia archaeon]